MEIRYIELKTGYSDNGPAWIGKVKLSKSGNTVYFNNKAFKKCNLVYGNHYDIETGEEYWISGIKKDGNDRHWAGNGKIIIAKNVIDNYMDITGCEKLDNTKFIAQDIPEIYPIERIEKLENKKWEEK